MRRTERPGRRARGLVLAAVAVIGLGLVGGGAWRATRPAPAAPASASAGAAAVATVAPAAAVRWPRRGPAATRAATVRPASQSPVDLYLVQSQYPPTSRPLDPARNPDLIDWNARRDEPRPAARDPRTRLWFTGDALRVIGDRPITTTLRVSRDGQPVDVRLGRAEVTIEAPRGAPLPAATARPIPLDYRLVDGAHVSTFRPATLAGIGRAVELVFRVEVDLGAAGVEVVALAVAYTPAAGAPARFTGAYREALEQGSLVIYAGVEVAQPGWYNVDANLWGAARPVAWTRWKGELAAGAGEVPLRFFGKVLTDVGVAAPWRLGELRGFRYDAEASPPEQWLAPPATPYTTAAHALADLSPAEWDAPARDRQLELLLADEAAGQAPPIPQASFDHDVAPATSGP